MKVNSVTFWVILFTHNGKKYLAQKRKHGRGADTPIEGILVKDITKDDLITCTFQALKEANKYFEDVRKSFENAELIQKTAVIQ